MRRSPIEIGGLHCELLDLKWFRSDLWTDFTLYRDSNNVLLFLPQEEKVSWTCRPERDNISKANTAKNSENWRCFVHSKFKDCRCRSRGCSSALGAGYPLYIIITLIPCFVKGFFSVQKISQHLTTAQLCAIILLVPARALPRRKARGS